MKKSDLQNIIREEIQKVLTETASGYISDIPTAWSTTQAMVDDLTQFLQDTYEANGPEGVEEIVTAMRNILAQSRQYLK